MPLCHGLLLAACCLVLVLALVSVLRTGTEFNAGAEPYEEVDMMRSVNYSVTPVTMSDLFLTLFPCCSGCRCSNATHSRTPAMRALVYNVCCILFLRKGGGGCASQCQFPLSVSGDMDVPFSSLMRVPAPSSRPYSVPASTTAHRDSSYSNVVHRSISVRAILNEAGLH
ncbi:hypothetical protein B0T13DRAFT_502622 [Neurospora crassa]|nr:hypothetical protein B0T13DRAFT_502622 [Neurospora crassa]